MPPRSRASLPAVLAALVLLSVAAARADHAVGRQTVTVHDPARGDRPIPVEILYPAARAGRDAPVAEPPAGGFPVVVFGHAYVTTPDCYAYLWEALVPAGYVMAFPATETTVGADHRRFGQDLACVAGWLRDEDARPGSPFAGRLSGRTAVGGHSLGGGAAVLSCVGAEGVDALFGLAPLETEPSASLAATHVDVPMLVLAGELDCVTPPETDQIPIFEGLASARKILAVIRGAGHCGFAIGSEGCHAAESGCEPATVTDETVRAHAVGLLHPWLDWLLRDDAAARDELRARLAAAAGLDVRQAGVLPAAAPSWGRLKTLHR